ncbi:MAG TPA: flagellar biosynthesis protein FlgL, partial [Erythrobacter sp.]|nr:flagellar biosynthesis protein FlgL [Erythrobacter sp.]
DVFNFDTANGPSDLFAVLGNLAAALATGGADAISASSAALGELDAGLEKVTTAQTVIGSRLNWVDLMSERREVNAERTADERSSVGGADIAVTMSRLQETLTVLEASQASFVRLANLSLFSLLR